MGGCRRLPGSWRAAGGAEPVLAAGIPGAAESRPRGRALCGAARSAGSYCSAGIWHPVFLEAAVLRTMRFPAGVGGVQRALPLLHPAGKVTGGVVQEVLAPLGAVSGTGAKWERGDCKGWECFLALLGLEVVVYRGCWLQCPLAAL